MKRTLATILLSVAAGAGAAQATDLLSAEPAATNPTEAAQPSPSATHSLRGYSPSQSLAPLVKELQPAVVNIQVRQKVAQRSVPMHPFFSPHWGMPDNSGGTEYRVKTGQGSGFLISADGYLLTNNHVVANADEVLVKLADDTEHIGTVVGTDNRIDIALVKIDSSEPLPYVEVGASAPMEVGDWVVAIGNPFGLSHTVTAGIVSAKGRVIGAGPYDDFIQTDASINPGNSGGPLFNLDGEVIGINTAINAAGQGIGFAVPTDMVSPFLDDLKSNGKISRGWLGISLQNLDTALSQSMGLDSSEGVLVAEVHAGHPGEAAGLKSGDVILEFDGQTVKSTTELIRTVGRRPAGASVNVQIKRNGQDKTLSVDLGERPSEDALRPASYRPPARSQAPSNPGRAGKLGIRTGDEDGKPGVSIVGLQPDTPAHRRLRTQDRILKVNGIDIHNTQDLERALSRDGEHAIFVIRRVRNVMWVAVPLN